MSIKGHKKIKREYKMKKIQVNVITPEQREDSIQKSSEITINRPTSPINLPRVNGINILDKDSDIETIYSNLKKMRIEVIYVLYANFIEGTRAVFLYSKTIHGHYILIELPLGIKVLTGDIELLTQRVDVLEETTLNLFKEHLGNIYTGYAFLCCGGIHLKRHGSSESIIYGYSSKFDCEKFNLYPYAFSLIPAVSYVNLAPPERLNTIEAYVNTHPNKDLNLLLPKSKLQSLFTMKGPFTLFLPVVSKLHEKSEISLRSILLAHTLIGKIDPKTISSGKKITLSYKAIAGNIIDITMSDGEITRIKSGNKTSTVSKKVNKFNGVIYITDVIFKPEKTEFALPDKSDIDDVSTIFDINKTTMEIRKIQFEINRSNQIRCLDLIKIIYEHYITLNRQIDDISKVDGDKLLKQSDDYVQLFYTRQVPCEDLCENMEQLIKSISKQNQAFEKVIRQSNALGSLKVPIEKILLNVLRSKRNISKRFED